MPDVRRFRASRRDFMLGAGKGALAAHALIGGLPATSMPAHAAPPARVRPFDLADVELGEGPFLHAQRNTEAYLLSLQPDRLLHNFRVNAGLAPRAPVYGGWESEQTWADINCHGHTL